jgi:hypothetical protein
MNAIEGRIRRGLDVDVIVSADEMLGSAVAGVRRRRRRRAAGVALATVAAVVVGVVAGNAVPKHHAAPVVPVERPKVRVQPSQAVWYSGIATDGTTLYFASHRCPDSVVAGRCTYPSSFTETVAQDEHFPVVLWRYADGRWDRLGAPGVSDHAQMTALPGGLLLVPEVYITDRGTFVVGPLRISLDRGESWVDWQLPWPGTKRCTATSSEMCTVAVSGDYVVVASERTWARRSIRSSSWEDISPPARGPLESFDDLGYDLLALDNGTLVAVANTVAPSPHRFYRVSRDAGSTWSEPHENPGHGTSNVERSDGSALYADCENQSQECGYYWSEDLEKWTKAPLGYERGLSACRDILDGDQRPNGAPVQVGALRYRLAIARYLHGRLVSPEELPNPDGTPHRIRRILQVSADNCKTWRPLLD